MITAQEVADIIRELPDEMVNPTEYGTCVYTSPYDENHHCIAGEVITRLGYKLPPIYSRLNEDSIYALLDSSDYNELSNESFEPLAVAMLVKAQETADRLTSNEHRESLAGTPFAWREAKIVALDIFEDGVA